MKHSESFTKLAGALVKVQGEMRSVTKDRNNPAFKGSKYATLDAITEQVRPLLTAHGLAVVQGANEPILSSSGIVVAIDVETMLIHESGEWLSTSVAVPVDKPTAQGAGSAVTYGRRYGLAAMLAVTTDDDDDGNAASVQTPPKRTAAPAKPPVQRVEAPKAPADLEDTLCPAVGHVKGKKLRDLPTETIEKVVHWCEAEQRDADFVKAARQVMAARAKASAVPE